VGPNRAGAAEMRRGRHPLSSASKKRLSFQGKARSLPD
jgi:hypothetical protein